MGKPPKKRVEGSGRVTAKGAGPALRSTPTGDTGTRPDTSSRYTPPGVQSTHDLPSPTWVPVLMFVLLGLGALMIFCNYLDILPGGTSNWYLLGGLGFVLGGIITATQFH